MVVNHRFRSRALRCAPIAVVAVVILATGSSTLAAQRQLPPGRAGRQGPPPPADDGGPTIPAGVTPAEYEQLFDAYITVQAQQELRLRDDQYGQFVVRLKNLQQVRRRSQNQRQMAIQQLRRLLTATDEQIDEAQIRDRLKAIDDIDTRGATEVRQALANLDQVLDVRQQARFRLLEERVERQKVDLLTRVRQNNPARGNPNRPAGRQQNPF